MTNWKSVTLKYSQLMMDPDKAAPHTGRGKILMFGILYLLNKTADFMKVLCNTLTNTLFYSVYLVII